MNNSQIIRTIATSINCIIEEFQNNTFTFLCESDIQCALFSKMRSLITDTIDFNDKTYKLNLVYSEYGSRIDIVFLDKEKIDLEDVKFLKNQDVPDIYSLNTLVGIELKYITRGYYNTCVKVSFDDYDKLCKLGNVHVENKLALCFVQDGQGTDKVMKYTKKNYSWTKIENGLNELEGVYVISPTEVLNLKNWCE